QWFNTYFFMRLIPCAYSARKGYLRIGFILHTLANSLSNLCRSNSSYIRQVNRQLLTAPTSGDITSTHAAPYTCADLNEHPISYLMTKRIVDSLEEINIYKD